MEKQELRERIWDELEESGEARFPFPPHNRIPNFAGADRAAERLSEIGDWQDADAIKVNPDSPQLPVRRAALRQGKTIYMAVPRLRDKECFVRLAPEKIEDIDHATTISGSAEVGTQVGPEDMESVDLIVSGSVAVDERGARVGKGEGYSDLEFAILRAFGLVSDETVTVSTVHEIQVVEGEVSTSNHDVPMDWIHTPKRTIRTDSSVSKPTGIAWNELSQERIDTIPLLKRLKP